MRLFAPAAVFALLAYLSQAAAAAPLPAQSPPDAQPFQDWNVRCVAGSLPPCEMLQTVQDKAGKRLLRLAIAYLPRRDRYTIRLVTPLGISLAKGVRITASSFSSQPIPFLRCDGAGCYVEGAIETGALDSLGRGAPQAKVTIAALNGRDIALPFSLRGFADARSAMESLARARVAVTPPAEPPAAVRRP
jgi:invasion protein IalB